MAQWRVDRADLKADVLFAGDDNGGGGDGGHLQRPLTLQIRHQGKFEASGVESGHERMESFLPFPLAASAAAMLFNKKWFFSAEKSDGGSRRRVIKAYEDVPSGRKVGTCLNFLSLRPLSRPVLAQIKTFGSFLPREFLAGEGERD